eukprot:CAMPEP_0202962048 /NCGR_PEP_ID=MMETSP1396-20130829/6134_1 /ASSEMBLY_ACC=CAM_ASM_000872 /TAXON_ID= /ORGANISM="Pseudokeronopsis sp., Strain Brazil" /LENGTH=86 /DNA_ID=CAMNT_0049682351 /DNA_START=836 /DNA_END=1096 /DNA_ORIENTATION=+
MIVAWPEDKQEDGGEEEAETEEGNLGLVVGLDRFQRGSHHEAFPIRRFFQNIVKLFFEGLVQGDGYDILWSLSFVVLCGSLGSFEK